MRLLWLAILVIVVGVFLYLRQCVDRKVEQVTGKEVVREGEEILGTWASKSPTGYIQFRLQRDGGLEYVLAEQPGNDTTITKGTYTVVGSSGGRSANYFPRLYAFGEKGDTLFNYYIRYVTPYNTTIDKYDRFVMSPNSVFDTIEYTFYRIKQ